MVGRVSALASAAVVVLAIGASTSTAAPPPAGPSSASPETSTGCDGAQWQSGPVTVTHDVSVPPVPVIKDVRVAQHPECGYDRVVLDVRGAVPGYSVRYVTGVVADASGKTIALPGVRYLLITLQPAQAHTDVGSPTVTRGIRQPRFPALASWVLAGDFEGVVRIALGLSGPASVRTGELPGRIYVDVRE
jgi:hypothetical protein